MSLRIAYFGGEPLGAPILTALIKAKHRPELVVCNPDRPAGRGRKLTPPPTKMLASEHAIPVWQPTTLIPSPEELQGDWDLFVVVAYNKILPAWLINIPKYKTINVHPSLLPKLRGASPVRSAILKNQKDAVGVTIMQMDAEMDHGPILAQAPVLIPMKDWPPTGPELDRILIEKGSELLIQTIPDYIKGYIEPITQDHTAATYCGRLSKNMAELKLDPYKLPTGEAAHETYRTIQAFIGIGYAWFMHNGVRYKITNAHLEGERLVVDTIVPANKKELAFGQVFNSN